MKLAEKLCLSFFPKKKIKTIGEEEKENILQSDKATEMGAGTECLGLLIGVYGFCVNKVRTKCIVLFYILIMNRMRVVEQELSSQLKLLSVYKLMQAACIFSCRRYVAVLKRSV